MNENESFDYLSGLSGLPAPSYNTANYFSWKVGQYEREGLAIQAAGFTTDPPSPSSQNSGSGFSREFSTYRAISGQQESSDTNGGIGKFAKKIIVDTGKMVMGIMAWMAAGCAIIEYRVIEHISDLIKENAPEATISTVNHDDVLTAPQILVAAPNVGIEYQQAAFAIVSTRNNGKANLRAAPGTNSAIIASIPAGTIMNPTGKIFDGWTELQGPFRTSKGITHDKAYIYGKLLEMKP